jgi:hypothetical protein
MNVRTNREETDHRGSTFDSSIEQREADRFRGAASMPQRNRQDPPAHPEERSARAAPRSAQVTRKRYSRTEV